MAAELTDLFEEVQELEHFKQPLITSQIALLTKLYNGGMNNEDIKTVLFYREKDLEFFA